MRTLVIYDSKFGNTARIAEAIARGAGTPGSVQVLRATEATVPFVTQPELLLLGGPTQRRTMSPDLQAFIDALPPGSLAGVKAATFDTRYKMATWLSGSAAKDAAGRLRGAGARLIAQPESYFIERDRPPKGVKPQLELDHLEDGALERAEAWGRAVAAALGARPSRRGDNP